MSPVQRPSQWASSRGLLAGRAEARGQEGRAGQMEGAEHPSRSDLCCHSSIFRLFANTSYNEY